MGYTTSTVHGIEVPDSAEANNVPEDIGKVVTALEAGSIVKRLTGAQISALTSPQKPAGLLVYNTTTNRLQISDGTNFADYVAGTPTYAIGTRTTNQTIAATATNDVTYPSEDDPSSILASGIITFPSAGLYSLTAWVQCTGSAFIGRAYLIHGSTTLASVDLSTYSNQYGVSMAATVKVAASDTAKVQAWNISPSDTLTISTARFAAVKIGA